MVVNCNFSSLTKQMFMPHKERVFILAENNDLCILHIQLILFFFKSDHDIMSNNIKMYFQHT